MSDVGGRADRSCLLDSSGAAAPPRDNGELVFAAHWESRAFGVALALHDAGRIGWEDFRQTLIAEIGAWEAAHPSRGTGVTTSAGCARWSGWFAVRAWSAPMTCARGRTFWPPVPL